MEAEVYYKPGMRESLVGQFKQRGIEMLPETPDDYKQSRIRVIAIDGSHAESFGSWDQIVESVMFESDRYGQDPDIS